MMMIIGSVTKLTRPPLSQIDLEEFSVVKRN